jgi:hypothetical protein
MTYRTAVKNVRKVFSEASDQEKWAGEDWYSAARREADWLCSLYSLKYGERKPFTIPVASHIIAAVSPGIRWEYNLVTARNIILGERGPMAGYSKNIAKAQAILEAFHEGREWDQILSGPKVRAFADNICNPDSSREVTVDVHAYSVAAGKKYTVSTVPAIKVSERKAIVRAYEKVAREEGLKPHEVQAICWVVWRRLHE